MNSSGGRWLVGMLLLWLVVTGVSLVLYAAYVGADETSTLTTLMNPGFVEGTEEQGGVFVMGWEYIKLLPDMLFFNYSIFTGAWVIFRWIGCILSISTIVMLALALKPSWL